jgi:hypothetical protein
MKMKLTLFNSAFIVALIAVALSNSSFGQGYGSQQGGSSKPAAAGTPATGRNAGKKPGEVLPSGEIVAVTITEEEAKKKYPMPNGKDYPVGINRGTQATSTGFVQSPYSSRVYDARGLGHGTLIVDEGVKKVFKKP